MMQGAEDVLGRLGAEVALGKLDIERESWFFDAPVDLSHSDELLFICLTSVLKPSRTFLWRSSFVLVRWISFRRSSRDAMGFSIVMALCKMSLYFGASGSSRAK